MSHERSYVFVAMLLSLALFAAPAKADINYTFIKMNCDKASHTLSLGFPMYSHHEDPDDIVAKIRSGTITDMYYFDDLAKSHQRITCDLGTGIVSFTAGQDLDHPRNDNLWLSDNNEKSMGGWFFNTGGKTLDIHASGDNVYDFTECNIWHSKRSPKYGECRYRRVVNGIITLLDQLPNQKK